MTNDCFEAGIRATVAVPLLDEAPRLPALLDAILAQTAPPERLQVLLVDGGSSDGTRALAAAAAARHSHISLLDNPRRLAAAALNLALAEAAGPVFLRLDARTSPAPDYVERCLARLQEGAWAGVAGPQLADGDTAAGRAHALVLNHPLGVGGPRYRRARRPTESETLYLGAYRCDWLRRVGGWDEAFAANEDFDLNMRLRRAGGRLLVDPAIRSVYLARDGFGELWRQYAGYGAWRTVTWRRHAGAMHLRHAAPAALIALLALALLLAPLTPWPLLLLLALYLGPLALAALRLAWPGLQRWPRLFLTFPLLHLAWGLGFWRGWLVPPRALFPVSGNKPVMAPPE